MPLRRIDVRQAGAEALGILVPPGQRTVVVLRPRGLDYDLLPVRWAGDPGTPPTFCSFDRDEAAAVARRLGRFLECAADGPCPVETLGQADAFQVWVRAEDYCWLVCARAPGAAYRPLLFPDLEAARAAARRLADRLQPGPGRQQHYYFNTQNFAS